MANIQKYLARKTADYEDEILSVPPQKTMITTGDKNQVVHTFDDMSVGVVTLSGSHFTASIQWQTLRHADAQTILDLYHDPLKANGRARTFYFKHPRILNLMLVCRFMSALSGSYTGGKPRSESIRSVDLRIEGVRQETTWDGATWDGATWA